MSKRTIITIHGLLEWQRPTYYCSTCKKGCAPLDSSLGLDKADTTLAVRDLVSFFVAESGFVETAQSLQKSRGIDLCASTVAHLHCITPPDPTDWHVYAV